jgi:ribosomal protein S18 acetylase RimI-like enzyme
MCEKKTFYFVRELTERDRSWVQRVIYQRWGDDVVIVHGVVYHPSELAGFAAFEVNGLRVVGLVTYVIRQDACEIVTLDSLVERQGIGTHLVAAVHQRAEQAGCHRLWLVTTNDNLNALRFYQKYGFCLAALYKEAVVKARQIKPSIPMTGESGIPIRDEIELEIELVKPAE